MVARLIDTSHPRTPLCVYYTDSSRREKSGRAKRISKWFKRENLAEAKTYLRNLRNRLTLVGTRGLAMDALARADFWAARQILDQAGHTKVPLRAVAERYVAREPPATGAKALLELLPVFLAQKQDVEHAKERTIENLRYRLLQWWERDGLMTTADLTREAAETLRARPGVSANTRRNDMGAASSFCTWLVERHEIPHNPFLGMKRPRVFKTMPAVWTNDEAARLLEQAANYARARYLPAVVLMLAGLRPSEVAHARIVYGEEPCVRVEGDAGKMRGRANRVAPLWPAAVEWLALAGRPEQGIRPLNNRGRATICQEAELHWKEDICRHTAISNRMAVLQDEARVAREAGTSPEVIFRHYHRLRTEQEAKQFFQIRPPVSR